MIKKDAITILFCVLCLFLVAFSGIQGAATTSADTLSPYTGRYGKCRVTVKDKALCLRYKGVPYKLVALEKPGCFKAELRPDLRVCFRKIGGHKAQEIVLNDNTQEQVVHHRSD